MKKTLAFITAILLIPAAVAFAHVPGHEGGEGPFARLKGTGYELTAEQQKQIEGFRAAFIKETADLKLALREKTAELHALLAARTPDREKILAKQREVSSLRAKLGEKALLQRLDIRSVLTPEQQALLLQPKERPMHRKQMAGHGSGGPPPTTVPH